MPFETRKNKIVWILDRMILILGILTAPHTHGTWQYLGLIVACILLVGLNHEIARRIGRADPR